MATIKEINHDSSTTLSDFYDTIFDPDGAFTVTPAAELGDSVNGVQADYDAGTQNARVDENFSASGGTELRYRFRINLDALSNASSSSTTLDVNLVTSGISGYEFDVFGDGASGFELSLKYADDTLGTTQVGSNVAVPSGDVCIELRSIRETTDGDADGEVEWYINGASQGSVINAENFTRFAVDRFNIRIRSNVAQFTGTLDFDELLLTDIAATGLCAAPLTLASMTKPASVDAAGEFIYLALLEGGNPILTKISTDLDADGTTVFNPGAGDNIGVECGRFNSDVVWVAGQFDGTNVVEKSENGGSSFVIKDDATIGGVRSFIMGPDNDNRLLIFDEDNGDILETRDGGESWTTINSAVTPEINAIARLGQNVEESVFGNDGGGSDSISYSVNSGDDLEDYQTGVYPATNATKVIVN